MGQLNLIGPPAAYLLRPRHPPLLQFAGQQLWDRRDEKRQQLTWAAYQEIVGVAGALARHADGVIPLCRSDIVVRC